MIAALVVLAAVVVVLSVALGVEVRHAAQERSALIEVIVAKHAGELRTIRSPQPPKAAKDFKSELDRDLIAMGYDPASVPAVPSGF